MASTSVSLKKCGSIGNDFTNYVAAFFENMHTHEVINTTWVTLIPKLDCPERVSDFRPISMVGCVYKVIAKVLCGRLNL